MKHTFALALAFLFIIGCSPHQEFAWTHLHSGDPDLATVRVQQYPDCAGEAPRYRKKHPSMILYVFKDGRVHQTVFEPDGKLKEDFWFKIDEHHWLWPVARKRILKTQDGNLNN